MLNFFNCTIACVPPDSLADTVRLDLAALGSADDAVRASSPPRPRPSEQQLPQEQTKNTASEERVRGASVGLHHRLEAEREETRRQKEDAGRLEREANQKAVEEARAAREAARGRADDKEQLRREAAARELLKASQEADRRAEAERADKDRMRRAALAAFLQEHGFTNGVSGPKRNLVNTTYPLHRAAKRGDAQIVEWLIQEGADLSQTNSAGRTAEEVALKHNAGASHYTVLKVFNAQTLPRAGSGRRVGGA